MDVLLPCHLPSPPRSKRMKEISVVAFYFFIRPTLRSSFAMKGRGRTRLVKISLVLYPYCLA